MFDGTGQPDGERNVDQSVNFGVTRNTSSAHSKFSETPELRKWSMDQGNLMSEIARTHRLGLYLKSRDRQLSRNIEKKSVISSSKQLKPKKSADFYEKNYGDRNWNFVKLINEVLQRWRNYEKFQSSFFDTIARRKLIEDQNTILELYCIREDSPQGVWCTQSPPFSFYLSFLPFSVFFLYPELFLELDNPIVMASLRYSAAEESEDTLNSFISDTFRTSTARPVYEPSSSQKRKSGRDTENERIRILLERQKEQILAEVRTEIQKHEILADSDRRSIQELTGIIPSQRREIDHTNILDRTGRPVSDEFGSLLSSVRENPCRDSEKEQIRILLERQKEQFLADFQAEIQQHEFQADCDRRSTKKLNEGILSQRGQTCRAHQGHEQHRRDQELLHEQIIATIENFVKIMRKVLMRWKNLSDFKGSTFDSISRRRLIEDRDTFLELIGKIHELLNEINCVNDSRDFQVAESVRSGPNPRYQSTSVLPTSSRSWRNAKPFSGNAEPQRRADKHLGHAWYFGKRFCKSSCVFYSTLSWRIQSMGL